MSLMEHAKEELARAGYYNQTDSLYGGMVTQAVEEIIQTFAKQGHSGGSASIVIGLVGKLLRYEPLTPLTGKPDEWRDVSEHFSGEKMYQNKRCSRVFATDLNGGNAYDVDGKVFRDKDGLTYTNRDSHVSVLFPYTPTTVIVDRDSE